MAFAFEELRIYQESIAWINRVCDLKIDTNIALRKAVIDQLGRIQPIKGAVSTQAQGLAAKPERIKFFWIARGSQWEHVQINRETEMATDTYDALRAIDHRIFINTSIHPNGFT